MRDQGVSVETKRIQQVELGQHAEQAALVVHHRHAVEVVGFEQFGPRNLALD